MFKASLFIWSRCLVGGPWLIPQITILSLLVYCVPLRSEGWLAWVEGVKGRLGRAEEHGVLLNHYHNPSATGVLQDLSHLPRWVCFLQAAAETRSTFIAQKQNRSPFTPTPFLSWKSSSANTSGYAASSLAPLASRGRTTDSQEAPSSRGNVRYYVGPSSWSLSHRSQAAFVSCFVSSLISLC